VICDSDPFARIYAVIQKLALPLRNCCGARKHPAGASAPNQAIARNRASCISLIARGAHGSPDQRGLKNQGRTRKSAAVCA